jgi:CRISPR-associated protein Cmr2
VPSRLLLAKLAALLHDPAWKPWVVSSAFSGVGRVLAKVPDGAPPAGDSVAGCAKLVGEAKAARLDAHQADAAVAAERVLEGFSKGLALAVREAIEGGVLGEIVEGADRLASALDRWIVTYESEKLRNLKVDVSKACYANPLDPRFKVKLKPSISPEVVCSYVASAREVAKRLKGAPLPLLYNTLYLVLEHLWYKSCRGCVPPADTRTPTHTVFDHVQAAASMVNLTIHDQKRPCGFIVKIDVAGIQSFIASSRKTRDLWAGSWLVSALAWYTVSEAVSLLGADIVLSPFAAANHFYIAMVLKQLDKASRKISSGAREEIERIVEEGYLWQGAANQPLMPGTLFLVLPCIDEQEYRELWNEAKQLADIMGDEEVSLKSADGLLEALMRGDAEGLRRYFLERFREGWARAAKGALLSVVEREEDLVAETLKELAKHKLNEGWWDAEDDRVDITAAKYLSAAVERPPLYLRVVVVDVAEEYEKLRRALEEVCRNGVCGNGHCSVSLDEASRKLLLHWLFAHSIPSAEGREHYRDLAVGYGVALSHAAGRVTSKAYREGRMIRDCSVCGRLPSIAYRGQDAAPQDGPLARLLTEGERLCPYCLIRRLISQDQALIHVMNELGLYTSRTRRLYPRAPSTCELAALNEVLSMVDRLAEALRKGFTGTGEQRVTRNDIEKLKTLCRGCDRDYDLYQPVELYIEALKEDEELSEADAKLVKSLLGCLEERYDLTCLIASGSLRNRRRCVEALGKGSEEICEILGKLAGASSRYFAVIRGDGDFFGKRIVRGVLDLTAEEYVDSIGACVSDESYGLVAEELKCYSKLLTSLAKSLSDEGGKQGEADGREPTVVLTPAYYTALSRSQMVTAIVDSILVAALGGFPVYAGGDDVAAIAPGHLDLRKLEKIHQAAGRRYPELQEYIEYLRRVLQPGLYMGSASASTASIAFIPADIVLATRLNYWGLMHDGHTGFHIMPSSAVYPAPVSYGRSYGVFVAHYRDPFQAVWRLAGELEERKDVVVFERGAESSEKDVVVLYYGRVGLLPGAAEEELALLCNLCPGSSKNEVIARGAKAVSEPLSGAAALAAAIAGNHVPTSLIYDMLTERDTLRKLALRGDVDVAQKLLERVAERNISDRGGRSTVRSLVVEDIIGRLTSIRVASGGLKEHLSLHVVLASRILLAGRR